MVERLLFDWIDAEPAAAAVGRQNDLVVEALSNKAETSLAFVQLAKPRT